MPTYEVTDPTTGRTLSLTGNSPPTEAELEEIFGTYGLAEEDEQNTLLDNYQAANQKVLDGLFLGFGDEFIAATQATHEEFFDAFKKAPGMIPTKIMAGLGASALSFFQDEDTLKDYEDRLEKGRAIEERFERDNPIVSTGLEIAGALGATIGTGGLAGAGMAATRVGNVARLGATSAAEVAVYEIGEGEGGIQARVEGINPASVLLGLGIGGIGGAFLRGIAETPQQKQIFDRAVATKKDTIVSEASAAATRGALGPRRQVVTDPGTSITEKLKRTTDALGLRSKNWHAENVSEASARKYSIINAKLSFMWA